MAFKNIKIIYAIGWKPLFLFLLSVISIPAYAQKKDFEIWAGLKYKTIHSKRVATNISIQSRFHENATRFQALFVDFNLAYRLSENIEVSGSYVLVQQNTLRYGLETYHQYHAGVNYDRKIKAINISYDFIVQNNHKDFFHDSREWTPSTFGKNRLKMEYKIKKSYFPYVYSDLRHRLFQDKIAELNRLRIGTGLGYRLDSNSRIDIYCLYQKYFLTNIPRQRYVIGITCKFRSF